MKDYLWRLVAWIVTRPRLAAWLIRRAERVPYNHIYSQKDGTLYMGRWWLFNPYPIDGEVDRRSKLMRRLPSVRIHRIMRPDNDRHLHDHPWDARTIVLRGFYIEERPIPSDASGDFVISKERRAVYSRTCGYTGRLLFGQYHRISRVSGGGVYTLFITGRKLGTWGFDVDGVKVPWREYLGIGDARPTVIHVDHMVKPTAQQDGSSEHPFRTVAQAIERASGVQGEVPRG